MADEVRQKIKKMGSLQKEIILWLGEKQGVTSVYDLQNRWPATETVYEPSQMEKIASMSPLTHRKKREKPTPYAPYLTEEYFQGDNPFSLKGDWVEWRPGEFLGHKPSALESTSLSKGIRGLEERKLLETVKAYGKKRRISHVKLTFHGEVASVLLRTKK